ncbi:hypothetical protein KY084_12515 [Stakelama sp. CBK3Z-3]|uniref:Uncharacterized protein n=1 Tax=Stakelama flava TaxID=2860338 RepID=A0ABS6XPI5_9SPHN|nr:hypothetical protein [Stakelama flava]MBW4331693.1 hypothetical protein [Stakelama flava]
MALLWKIECYLRRTDMPPSKFGRLAVGDPRLVHDLRNGREPRQSMVERVESFMERHAEPRR